MENFLFLLALLLFSSGAQFFLMANAQLLSIADDNQQGNNTKQIRTYIVHVEDPVSSRGELLRDEDFESWHRSFLPNATLDSGEPRLIYSYRHVIGGFAARLTHEEVAAMEDMEGFLHAWPEQKLVAYTTRTPDFLGLNEYQGLWYSSSYATGMVIGILDSGIEPSHPSFSDNGMPPPPSTWRGFCAFGPGVCNNKVIGAISFQRGAHPLPIDDNGHGTHVASTVAGSPVYNADFLEQAKGRAVGMAPRAHIAMYKVLHRNGSAESDFLAAINQAIQDGVDVLSMSLGAGRVKPLDTNSIAIGCFGAIMHGIFPSAAAGNFGPTPSIIDNVAPWLLTVGASSIDRRIWVTVKLGNNIELYGQSAMQPAQYNSPQLPLEFPGLGGTYDQLTCEPGSLNTMIPQIRGKMVVCLSGGRSSNADKSLVVKDAGGAAMIVMNDVQQGETTHAEPFFLPAVHVGHTDSWKIIAYAKTFPNPTASIEFRGTVLGFSPSPTVSSFSSRGPSTVNGGIIKPDIIGPGVDILAASHLPDSSGKVTGFVMKSGTSMATPHLSGIAANLKKTHPDWSPAAIKSAMMTTAYARDQSGQGILDDATGRPATFFVKGSGHVHPDKANDPGLVYDMQPIDYVPYLCYMFPSRVVAAFIRQRIDCSLVPKASAEHLNYPSIAVTLGTRGTKVVSRTLTNVAGAETYKVNITVQPPGVVVKVDTNSLGFTSLYEKKSFRLQFTGLGMSVRGQVSEGYLLLDSGRHAVWSPISVTFV